MSAWTRDPHSFAGSVEMRPFRSAALADNPLADPAEREVPVWLPPGVEPGRSSECYPVVFVLAGFTGRPHKYLETHPWQPGIVTRFDRAVASGAAPPAILVLPDAFTKLGGSQYVNSSAVGRYEDYVATELVAWVDEHYPTDPAKRAICGKSSGGFGAVRLAMRHPETFRAAASISGDMGFELSFAHEIPACLRGLVAFEGDPRRFPRELLREPEPRRRRARGAERAGDGCVLLPQPQEPARLRSTHGSRDRCTQTKPCGSAGSRSIRWSLAATTWPPCARSRCCTSNAA